MSSTKSGDNNSSNGDNADEGLENQSQTISDLVCVEYPGLVNSNQVGSASNLIVKRGISYVVRRNKIK